MELTKEITKTVTVTIEDNESTLCARGCKHLEWHVNDERDFCMCAAFHDYLKTKCTSTYEGRVVRCKECLAAFPDEDQQKKEITTIKISP